MHDKYCTCIVISNSRVHTTCKILYYNLGFQKESFPGTNRNSALVPSALITHNLNTDDAPGGRVQPSIQSRYLKDALVPRFAVYKSRLSIFIVSSSLHTILAKGRRLPGHIAAVGQTQCLLHVPKRSLLCLCGDSKSAAPGRTAGAVLARG